MNLSIEYILLIFSILLLLSVITSKIASRTGVPALLIFLGVGMLAGTEGPGGIYFDDPYLVQTMGTIALAFILFSGGLDTKMESIKSIMWSGISLSTIGVIVSTFVIGLFLMLFFKFSLVEGLLIGAILSSTDAAAVFSILRNGSKRPRKKLLDLLEMESGSNDPMAVFLTIAMLQLIKMPDASAFYLFSKFFVEMIVGFIAGYALGNGMAYLTNKIKLEYDGLYSVMTISFVPLAYYFTVIMGGSGFLSVYVASLILGNKCLVHRRSLLTFHDGLAWLMQIVMFLILGLQIYPSNLLKVIDIGLIISFMLIIFARPISVFISLIFSKFSFKEQIFISFVGLRGAVPIILATYPLLARIHNSTQIFNIVFFVVITSVLIQGTAISKITKWLKLPGQENIKRQYPIKFEPSDDFYGELFEIIIPNRSKVAKKAIYEMGIPSGVLVVLLCRGDEFIVPDGRTILEAGDAVLMLGDRSMLNKIREIVESKT
jgi:potassium/hydrogen antiporter